jgi:crotonobetainyl-CoA:carnitine CoA-transferase CaiB-like acyl-CoA transferase
VVANEQSADARNMFPEIDDPEVGKMRFPTPPFKMSETMPEIRSAAPMLGQHNDEVFASVLG